MQETQFISQNKDKWREFEDVLQGSEKDPDRLTNLFIETTDDLSFSRTYYANRSVRVYLNGVAQLVYQAIYRNRSKQKNVFRNFWGHELPAAMWHGRIALLQSFLVFAAGVFIGILSSVHYPEFAKIILGDGYVEMTEANIESGDPMAVYKDENPVSMFFMIALNNIRIGFLTFVLGVTFAVGTYYVILYNAIMVGAFIYFFIERNLFKEAFLAIMLHGTLELSMIVLSGCAGLVLARGLLFPGTYTRGQALVHSARSGIKIMIAVTLFLLYAALIESFATRITDLPGVTNGKLIVDIGRAILIIISFGIVIGYFVVFPRMLHRRGKIGEPSMEELPGKRYGAIKLNEIKGPGRIFNESFSVFGKFARQNALIALVISSLFTLFYLGFTQGKLSGLLREYDEYIDPVLNFIWVWSNFDTYLNFERFPLALVLLLILGTFWLPTVLLQFRKFITGNQLRPKSLDYVNGFFASIMILIPMGLSHAWTVLIELFWFPFCLTWLAVAAEKRKHLFEALNDTLNVIRGNFWMMIFTFLLMLSIQWLGMMIMYSEFSWLPLEFISMNVSRFSWLARELPYMLHTVLLIFTFTFMFSLSVYCMALYYYAAREINEAGELRQRISKIGIRRRAYGLEQEQ